MKKRFNIRAMISFLVTLSFIIVLLSGIALYFAPSARVARAGGWNILGIDRWQFESLHNLFGYFFAIVVAFHLYFNWRIFLSYIKSKIMLKREFIVAIIIMILVLFVNKFFLHL